MRKIIISVCLGLILLLTACSEDDDDKSAEQEDATPTPVEVAEVETGDFVVEKTVYGETAPKKQMPVMLDQPSEVKTLKVKNGDTVEKDDHLATVKSPMGDQTIRANTAGVVAQLKAKEGSFQSNEEPLLIIADLDTMLIHYAVTSDARELFKLDEEMTVHMDKETYKARVTSIDSLPNETGQYTIELELDNEDSKVLAGVPAKVILAEKKVKQTKIVPTEAILTEGDEQFVFIVKDDSVERVIVEVEETQSEKSAVKAGLEKDDQVVVKGHFTLTDQAKVDIQKEDN